MRRMCSGGIEDGFRVSGCRKRRVGGGDYAHARCAHVDNSGRGVPIGRGRVVYEFTVIRGNSFFISFTPVSKIVRGLLILVVFFN